MPNGLQTPVACLGEILTDFFPDGSSRPGGAPANVAFHVAQAGRSSSLVSRVGCGADGDRLLDWAVGAGIGAATLQRDETHATGAVRVRVAVHGPLYDIAAPAAWDFIEANGTAMDLVRTAGAVVFGTLAQRHPVSRGSIRALVRAAREAGVPCLADLNLRPPHFDEEIILWTLRNTDVLKMNVEELRMVSEMLGARGSVENLFEGLVREFGVPRAVVTDGADGAWICENGTTTKVPAEKAESVDPVGAGDAFTAMIACGLAKGTSLAGSAPRAAHLSAWVVASRGAAPAWTPELRRTLGD